MSCVAKIIELKQWELQPKIEWNIKITTEKVERMY